MIICLAGMHRSGTSLMASYFQACGINMGERLVGPATGNRRGHFEDTEFVSFHEGLLRENSARMLSPGRRLVIPDDYRARARRMIDSRNGQLPVWGWKDPRTTLFLEFWREVDPGIRFVLLYRPAEIVADSLRRRKSDRRVRFLPWIATTAWLRYNRDALAFARRHPESAALVSIAGFNRSHERARRILADWLGTALEVPYSTVYAPAEIAASPARRRGWPDRAIDSIFARSTHDLHESLDEQALISSRFE